MEEVARATFSQLRELGLTEKQAGGLLAAFELGKRGVPRAPTTGAQITTPGHSAQLQQPGTCSTGTQF